jgi:hypothetical protein
MLVDFNGLHVASIVLANRHHDHHSYASILQGKLFACVKACAGFDISNLYSVPERFGLGFDGFLHVCHLSLLGPHHFGHFA